MARNRYAVPLIRYGSVPVGLVIAGALIMQSSNAAFVATTSNPTSNWTAGSVALSDDDSNTALFTATAIKPGATATKCILVTYTGTVASTVELYGTSYATTNALGTYLDLTIEEGSGGNTAGCGSFVSGGTIFTGTVAGFGTNNTSHATGVGTFAPSTNPTTKSYRFTYTFNASAPNSVQSGTAALGFTWEAQST